jgi:transcriptional regulator with XRE-family HTH domain
VTTPRPDRWRELGSFIREQRATSRLSLRRLSELAGISNPYLSQIERGLRRPSAEILQQIAKALRISAETLYVQAGILDDHHGDGDLTRHILADPHLREEQKQALLRVYRSFLLENGAGTGAGEDEPRDGAQQPGRAGEPTGDPGDDGDGGPPGGRPDERSGRRVGARPAPPRPAAPRSSAPRSVAARSSAPRSSVSPRRSAPSAAASASDRDAPADPTPRP